MVASAFNPGTWEVRQIDLWDIKDSLGYTVSSKTNKGYIVKSIFKKKKSKKERCLRLFFWIVIRLPQFQVKYEAINLEMTAQRGMLSVFLSGVHGSL